MSTPTADHAALWRDFDVDLAAPGERSSAELDSLLVDLGVSVTENGWGEWVDRFDALAALGVEQVFSRLVNPDVAIRRTAAFAFSYLAITPDQARLHLLEQSARETDESTKLALFVALGRYADQRDIRDHLYHHLIRTSDDGVDKFGAALGLALHQDSSIAENRDDVVAALLLSTEYPGFILAELPWCDPEWETELERTIHSVGWDQDLQFLLLRGIISLLEDTRFTTNDIVETIRVADYLYGRDHLKYEELAIDVAALLCHSDPKIRNAAVKTFHFPAHPDYAKALANSLADPELFADALSELTRHHNHLAVEPLRRLIQAGVETTEEAQFLEKLLGYAGSELASELFPDIRHRLAEDSRGRETATLLVGTNRWGKDYVAIPETLAALERVYQVIEGQSYPDFSDLLAIQACCTILRQADGRDEHVLAILRRIASKADPDARLSAILALRQLDDSADEFVVESLLDIIAKHPSRSGLAGRAASKYDWRFDSHACARLGELGQRASTAVPTLRAMLKENGDAGRVRGDAAIALWKITGNAIEVLPVLIEQVDVADNPSTILYDIGLMGAAARPALPVLEHIAATRKDLADTARAAITRIRGSGSE